MNGENETFGPLAGLRVIDIATIIAAPFAASLLADFGADVIKFEMPGHGDGLRTFPPYKDGKPLWWKVTNRGKTFATLDLRRPEGADILKRFVATSDVLIENFRPGTLEKWGLDRDTLWAINPKLVILRVSAFGQTGPKASQGGFARIFEAMGGLTHITGHGDGPPIHPGYPLADAFGGLFGAFSILAALHGIDRNRCQGEEIDLALTEATFRLLENIAIEYDQLGAIRQRNGNYNQYTAPSNVYRTADGRYVTVASSTNSTFLNNCKAIGQPELAAEQRFSTNNGRLAHAEELDVHFAGFIGANDLETVLDAFHAHHGTIAPVYSVEQIFEDRQFAARDAIPSVPDEDFGTVRMQGVVPKLRNAPGRIRWAAKGIGADNDTVFSERLGLSESEIAALRSQGII